MDDDVICSSLAEMVLILYMAQVDSKELYIKYIFSIVSEPQAEQSTTNASSFTGHLICCGKGGVRGYMYFTKFLS